MTVFLWTIGVLIAITTLGEIIWLSKGEFPIRRPGQEAGDVVINVAILIWIAVLLSAN